jgi:hypothetical protein
VAPNGSLAGRGRTLREGQVVDSEVVRITVDHGTLRYTANPQGQAEAVFVASEVTDSGVTFTNPAHDFPTRITYRRGTGARLFAEVAGPGSQGERVISFPYAAVVCRDD